MLEPRQILERGMLTAFSRRAALVGSLPSTPAWFGYLVKPVPRESDLLPAIRGGAGPARREAQLQAFARRRAGIAARDALECAQACI
jgi:hypothetical protein